LSIGSLYCGLWTLKNGTVGVVNLPGDLRYTSDHEWVRKTSETSVQVGITDYAQDALGDVVFVQPPTVGDRCGDGSALGEVESTKSVSEIYAPVAGEVIGVNTTLEDNPELLNSDPYGAGWICEIRVESMEQVDALMDAAAYQALIEG
jgi:glycine cleavage system H protein